MLDQIQAPKITEINLKRPRVALRRITDPMLRLSVKALILNWRTEAKQAAMDDVMRRL